jgi:hypothetical protein
MEVAVEDGGEEEQRVGTAEIHEVGLFSVLRRTFSYMA